MWSKTLSSLVCEKTRNKAPWERLMVSECWQRLLPLQWEAKETLIGDGPSWILCPLLSEGTEIAPSKDALSRWFNRRKESCWRGILEGDLCSRSKTILSGLLGWPVWRQATAQTAVFSKRLNFKKRKQQQTGCQFTPQCHNRLMTCSKQNRSLPNSWICFMLKH